MSTRMPVAADGAIVCHALFLCSQHRLRSPTAEQGFAGWPGVAPSSAGLNHDPENAVTPEVLAWAGVIAVMGGVQRSRLSSRFQAHIGGKRIICLGISDDFTCMAPALVARPMATVPPHLPGDARMR